MDHKHQLYRRRRVALQKHMRANTQGGIALVPTAGEVVRSRDSHFPFRHDSYFYYLCGFPEPDAVLALVAEADGDRHILFCREKNPEREIWDGFRYGPDAAREVFGFDAAYPLAEMDAVLADLVADRPALYTPLGQAAAWDRKVADLLNEVRNRARTGVAAPEHIVDVRQALDAMRLVKDEHERSLMRRAAEISSGAHRRAMAATRPGWFEYQVEAELVHEFLRHGAQAVAYPSIVAGGPNACVLHYRDNNRQLQDGELLLIDADAVQPGAEFHDYHKVAERVLAQGLVDLGLLAGTQDEVLESGSYKQFYMHRAGHWLGMDVHDAGRYQAQGASMRLAPGMVLTVEPGLYIRRAENVPEAFWDIGVRIEDDLLVTDTGSENLTGATPRTVAEVEDACRRD